MALAQGTQLGSYRIIAPVGSGGMGEVYRATDTRLNREVAVKILPEHLARSPEARERFEREAKVISSLSHPGICTLFDIGTQGDISYLVMELLEGETLASRIEKGPMKLEETLRLGAQVADALDKAHRKGVVHRDLKPANLMLTRNGVKVLDFGVAKLREEPAGAATGAGILPTMTPTRTTPLTTEGSIVGTMQYMAPEQLEGKPVDHRSDIFSLGAVLYETITARRAFDGASQASVIAAIIEREPRPVSELASSAPPSLDRAIGRCLAKDPDARWQSCLDLKSELEWISQQSGTSVAARPAAAESTLRPGRARGRNMAVTALLAVVGAGAIFALGWMLHRPAPAPARLLRASIVMPKGTTLDTDNASIALSPDGTMVAYTGQEAGGAMRLFVRRLDSLTSQPLAGTEGATYPFWSPDGFTLGFMSSGKLKKVPASGGTVQTICDAEEGRGASWGDTGMIVFAPRPKGGLEMVPASGGAPAKLTTPTDENITQRNPRFLPGGKRLLFYSGGAPGDPGEGIYSLDLQSRKPVQIMHTASEGIYVEPGYLAFVRDGNLMAQPIDLDTLRTSGEAVPIAENVQFNSFRATGTYTFSRTGLLLFQSGAIQGEDQLTWYDLDGKRLGTLGEPAIFWISLAISPDGRKAVATVRHPAGGSDLWTYDLARGLGTRFTFGETHALAPRWSPDGRQVAYIDGNGALYVKASDGATPARKVFSVPGGSMFPTSWSRDGARIIYATQSAKTNSDLWILPMIGEAKPTPFLTTTANEENGTFSPDGRWVAYTSDESGRKEVYVRSFPGPGGNWQVSTQGAGSGGWYAGRMEIGFADLENRAFVVSVTPKGEALEIGTPRPLFGGNVLPVVLGDFTPDGKRFLGATPVGDNAGPVLTMVLNWPAALERK